MQALQPVRQPVGGGVDENPRVPNLDRNRPWLAVSWRDDRLELNAEMVRLGWALA